MPISPELLAQCRKHGYDRLEIARKSKSPEEWNQLWTPPKHPFSFQWTDWWKMTVEYKVDDFPAEVGFYIDILGCPINALDHAYAMFTGPNEDFHISVVPTPTGERPTAPDAFKIEFMVKNIQEYAEELENRGVTFKQKVQRYGQEGSKFKNGWFRTPHGIVIMLWGVDE
ncbi:MAG: VOC family protein [Calditrichota bacterium]